MWGAISKCVVSCNFEGKCKKRLKDDEGKSERNLRKMLKKIFWKVFKRIFLENVVKEMSKVLNSFERALRKNWRKIKIKKFEGGIWSSWFCDIWGKCRERWR